MIGQCKLCLSAGVQLLRSHFLPAAMYRILRSDSTPNNPHHWTISERGAVQSSKQLWAWLLCTSCERRFASQGEDWIFRHGLRPDRTFPLATALSKRTPDSVSPQKDARVYYAANIPDVNVHAITYFAASMFWRAAIHPWRTDGGYPLKLGLWEERFRRYLVGEADFPADTALLVIVRDRRETDGFAYNPMGGRLPMSSGTVHAHKFSMPGFAFKLTVSKNVPEATRTSCFVRGYGNPLHRGRD